MISIKIAGLSALQSKILTAPRRVGQAISKAIKKSAFVLEAESKKALTSGPTRALDTGTLRSQVTVRQLSDIQATIYPLVDYAIYIHEGTYKMRARPWFNAAAKNSIGKIKTIFDNAIKKALK